MINTSSLPLRFLTNIVRQIHKLMSAYIMDTNTQTYTFKSYSMGIQMDSLKKEESRRGQVHREENPVDDLEPGEVPLANPGNAP
jgi:hypothetical protein